MTDGWSISYENTPIWMALGFTCDKLTLVQVMAWCLGHQAITWTNVDPDLSHHMASLDHKELNMLSQHVVKKTCCLLHVSMQPCPVRGKASNFPSQSRLVPPLAQALSQRNIKAFHYWCWLTEGLWCHLHSATVQYSTWNIYMFYVPFWFSFSYTTGFIVSGGFEFTNHATSTVRAALAW